MRALRNLEAFFRWRSLAIGVATLCAAGVLASCSSGGTADGPSAGGARKDAGASTRPTEPQPTTTTTTTVPPEPGWTVVATEPTGVAIDKRTLPMTDGAAVTVLRFRAGQVHFDLHVGSQDPPVGSAVLPADAQDAISSTEAPILLAAFNGGFKVTADAGGVEADGQVLTPLEPGLASFVIDAGGAGSIGVWGPPGFPPPDEQVLSVRQNLAPLVVGGQPSAAAATWTAWGATVAGSAVARSALGEDAKGDLLYAASASAVPLDLANALVSVGAEIGMELDINPDWVQADVAASAGAPLTTAVPGQNPPADQYEQGWTRDFITVLAGGPQAG